MRPLVWFPRHAVPAILFGVVASGLGLLNICTSIRRSYSPGSPMQIRPKIFYTPHVRVTAPFQRGAGTRTLRGGIGELGIDTGTGDVRLRWTFFDPSCRKSKEARPRLADMSTATPLPRGGASVVSEAVRDHR